MRIALDTNILVYAEGVNDVARRDKTAQFLQKLSPQNVYVPLQALAELFYVLVRKSGAEPAHARGVVLEWREQYGIIDTSHEVLLSAMDLALDHRFRIWDAIIIAAAASADCRLLLSEDLQDGFTWSGVTVVNPFGKTPNELLAEALDQ